MTRYKVTSSEGRVALTSEQEAARDVEEAKAQAEREEYLAKYKYKDDRRAEYPSFEAQFDLIYHSGIDAWKSKIKETKDKYAKPE